MGFGKVWRILLARVLQRHRPNSVCVCVCVCSENKREISRARVRARTFREMKESRGPASLKSAEPSVWRLSDEFMLQTGRIPRPPLRESVFVLFSLKPSTDGPIQIMQSNLLYSKYLDSKVILI